MAPVWEGRILESGRLGVQSDFWLQRECETGKDYLRFCLKCKRVVEEGKKIRTQGHKVALSPQQQLCKLVLTGFLYPAKLLIQGGLLYSNPENRGQISKAYKILKKNNLLLSLYSGK